VEPGEITADGKFSLDTVECLGSCGTAPMLQLGSRFVENLSVKTTLELIDGLEN
jgi:NADH-quinone oxidoreductase subunit E